LNDFYRGRRLRRTQSLRDLVRETDIRPQDLIQPYFVLETEDPRARVPIPSMPGQEQLGVQALIQRVGRAIDSGLGSVILFGIPLRKDEKGSQAYSLSGIIQKAVAEVKSAYPDLTVITDVCLCEYTSHGHCGLIQDGDVDNDPTLDLLARTALSHALAGADIVAPSDMMDGRVLALRRHLDANEFAQVPILSYAVKYASSFYGPFRDAAQSAPSFGDRRTYQMDPGNSREAILEASADVREGADMLMVKPAMPYLDIIRAVRERFEVPLAAYQVSGEFSMIKAAGELGVIDQTRVMMESLTSIKRAGADLILTYFAEEALAALQQVGS